MTTDEFIKICRDICPHCRIGIAVRQRTDSGEWVHDIFRGTAVSHGVCMATHFRDIWKDKLT